MLGSNHDPAQRSRRPHPVDAVESLQPRPYRGNEILALQSPGLYMHASIAGPHPPVAPLPWREQAAEQSGRR